jgi:hypothetical protein
MVWIFERKMIRRFENGSEVYRFSKENIPEKILFRDIFENNPHGRNV